MASMSLGLGYTNLRKYNFGETGYFYSSMSLITIGLERLMKLIVIYDHRINYGKFPSNNELKSEYGHKLHNLFSKSIDINSNRKYRNDCDALKEDSIYASIITFLSDFAEKARYYNLDCLTGKKQNNLEPLKRWEKQINSIILQRHYKPRKSKKHQIEAIASLIENTSAVSFHSESGENITSAKALFLEGDKIAIKQKYSMYYIYVISRFLSVLLCKLEAEGNFYPHLNEFFYLFRCENKSYILRRRIWIPDGT